jgi:hypothetical protein
MQHCEHHEMYLSTAYLPRIYVKVCIPFTAKTWKNVRLGRSDNLVFMLALTIFDLIAGRVSLKMATPEPPTLAFQKRCTWCWCCPSIVYGVYGADLGQKRRRR